MLFDHVMKEMMLFGACAISVILVIHSERMDVYYFPKLQYSDLAFPENNLKQRHDNFNVLLGILKGPQHAEALV